MKTEPVTASAIRCGTCNKLLAKGHLDAGEIELLCPRCKTRILLRASRPSLAPHDGLYGEHHARNVSSRT